MDTQQWFWKPVDTRKVVGYLDIVKNPMDLATIREGILNNKYQSREEFLNDIRQIVKNSEIFNGENNIFTLKVKFKLHQMEYVWNLFYIISSGLILFTYKDQGP